DALADDRHELGAFAILVREVAPGDQRHAEHREKVRPGDTEPRAGVLFAVGELVAVDGELDAGTESAGVTPWNETADRGTGHARQRADAFRRTLVEIEDLG